MFTDPSNRFLTRRQLLQLAGGGLGAVAFADLLQAAQNVPENRLHHRPTAKRVLMLFMSAGVSHVDSYDYKPKLVDLAGQPISGKGNVQDVFFRTPGVLTPSFFPFSQYGETGKWCSNLFPKINKKVDELTFVHSMVAKQNSHGPAMFHMSTGEARGGSPSLGAWTTYALGSETQDLPAFVVMMDRGKPPSSSANWGNGYLPAKYQGTEFRSDGNPILDLQPPAGYSPEQQRASFELLNQLNERHLQKHPEESDLSARIAAYELAARMQLSAPDVADISQESLETQKLYGVDRSDPLQARFSTMCLRARRLLERGVRFVTVYSGGSNNVQANWDAHDNVVDNHGRNALSVDQPIAALLTDLKDRGLLEDTLVIWTGEFGRTPTSEGAKGRDHNISGFTMWMAGGGMKPGLSYGTTDEIGFAAEENPVPIVDFHATVLHALGLDHERLTYYYNGMNRRLTGVEGHVVRDLFKDPQG
ncbi:DUF1501 domain-containing protein [Planctomicrobium sp. SH668]|uniref:DUF1501 domain-containing protein n=1 Tax=Planctomicrobium sp. SH668 TaxID=3448126 RepID=UPI003F5B2802